MSFVRQSFMNISAPFIRRPIGTSLLTIALFLAGALAFKFLPVAPLPQVEFPVIQVSAGLPGASPETMRSGASTERPETVKARAQMPHSQPPPPAP